MPRLSNQERTGQLTRGQYRPTRLVADEVDNIMKPTEDRGRPSRLKAYLCLLALHHPPLAAFLANRGQNFLSVPDANLGDLCYCRRLEWLGAMPRCAVIAG